MTDTPNWTALVRAQDKIAGPPRPTIAWATARRTKMKIFDDRVEIGDWVLPHADVTHAHLYQTERGIKNRVLEIATPHRTVQINFNPGTDPQPHLPYTVEPMPFPVGLAGFRIFFWIFVIAVLGVSLLGF